MESFLRLSKLDVLACMGYNYHLIKILSSSTSSITGGSHLPICIEEEGRDLTWMWVEPLSRHCGIPSIPACWYGGSHSLQPFHAGPCFYPPRDGVCTLLRYATHHYHVSTAYGARSAPPLPDLIKSAVENIAAAEAAAAQTCLKEMEPMSIRELD